MAVQEAHETVFVDQFIDGILDPNKPMQLEEGDKIMFGRLVVMFYRS